MKITLNKIKINKAYLELVPRMNTEDDQAFDTSIKENGIQEPIILNQTRTLLDGHSRYIKAKKYQIKSMPYTIKQFHDKLLEKKYVIECNLQRRHLTTYQKVELGIPLLEIEKQLAQQRKKISGKLHGRGKQNRSGSKDPHLSAETEKGKSTEIVSNKVGLSNATMMRGKYVMENATDEQKERLRKGRTSITSMYNHLTRKERNLPKEQLPSGKWSCIMIDLPIKFDNDGVRGASSNNYETMTIEECKTGIINGTDINNVFSEDCVLFAWFQASTIFNAKEILEKWGFHCITNQIWNKERTGTGSWLANQHEHLVIAVRGKMPIPAERVPSIVSVSPENRTHSSKPKFFYDQIEKMYPNRKYLDIFSKYKHNENWTCFGDESPSEVKQ